jgi:hypothetical protein
MRGFSAVKSDVANTQLPFFSTKPQLFLYDVGCSVFKYHYSNCGADVDS